MMNIGNQEYFLLIFQMFFDDLIEFSEFDYISLYNFTADFKKANIIDKPIETIIKLLLIAAYKIKEDKFNQNMKIILYLFKCLESRFISEKKIKSINDNVSKLYENPILHYKISNLEQSYLSYTLELKVFLCIFNINIFLL